MVGAPRNAAPAVEPADPTRELWTLEATPLPESAPPQRHDFEPRPPPDERKPLNRLADRALARVRREKDPFALPRLAEPERPVATLPRRGRFAAWWSARYASVGVEEFLRARLDRYLAQSGVSLEGLPVELDLRAERVSARPRAMVPVTADWVARYVREHGAPALAPAIEHARAEAAHVDGLLDEARERLSLVRHQLDEAARAPSLAASDSDALDPVGRPPVPPPWAAAIVAFVAALVLAEAAQFSVPLLRGVGIAPGDVLAEARRKPAVVAMVCLLALGASASVFAFSAAALRRARALVELVPARWRIALHAAGAGALLAMAAGLAWTILVGGSLQGRTTSVIQFVVAMALPLSTPRLLGFARRLHAQRAEAASAAAAWDRVHEAAVARWTHANAVASATERECAGLEATRATWAQRLYLLRSRAAEVARVAAREAEAEAAELRAVADAIASALEADRRAYFGGGRHHHSADSAAHVSEPVALSSPGRNQSFLG